MSWRFWQSWNTKAANIWPSFPPRITARKDLEVSILKAVDENGEEILVTIDDDDELEAVYGALMDLIYEDEDMEEADEN